MLSLGKAYSLLKVRTTSSRRITTLLIHAVLGVGEEHKRMRKSLAPAFSYVASPMNAE